MTAPENKAVFLSYASQDAEAARRICDALRASGVEVWFDQSELRGGDAWDAKIRKQIKASTLFIPIISSSTQARTEGYFRLEWRLADQRTHLMARGRPFLLPVVIDDTRDADAHVPDSFTDVQWTWLPGGEAPAAFCDRVTNLLRGEMETAPAQLRPIERSVDVEEAAPAGSHVAGRPSVGPRLALAAVAILLAGAGLNFALRARRSPEESANLPAGTLTPASDTVANSTPPGSPAVAAPPSKAQELAGRARALLLKPSGGPAKYDTAALLCDQAITLDPTDADAWAIASEVDTRIAFHSFDSSEKRLASAQSKAARAINLAPGSFEAQLAQATYQALIGGDPVAGEAETTLRALRTENPRETRVLFALGVLLRKLGRGEEAIACDDDEARLPGGIVEGLTQKAWALRGLWRLDEADAALDQAIAHEPIAGNVGLKVFLDLSWHGDPDQALATLRKLPADELTMDVGVAAAVRLYRWRREPAELLKFLAAVPRDWLPWSIAGPKAALTGDANAELNRPAAARTDWQSALALVVQHLAATPNDRELLQWKAYLEASLGDRAEAQRTWQRSLEAPRQVVALLNVEKIHRVLPPDQVIDELERRANEISEQLAQGRQMPLGFFSAADLRLNPAWDGLRRLPRFQALQARLDADPHFSPTAKKSSATVATPDGKSVAVLAFDNLSNDQANEWFSEGISDELINVLGRVPGLKVTARTSSFYFKGKQVPLAEIARQLGVAYVVEGSVQRMADQVKIAARLSKAADGFQIWSDSFPRDARDVFAVESEIAGLIAKQLSLKLGATSPSAPLNPKAFELYTHAVEVRNASGDAASRERAERFVNAALALEPHFIPAQAELTVQKLFDAVAAGQIGRFDQRESEAMTRLLAEARAIVAASGDSPEAHNAFALALGLGWKIDEAMAEYRRALLLNPNAVYAHTGLGAGLRATGYLDEALEEGKRSYELDPLVVGSLITYGHALDEAGRYRDALAKYELALTLQPNDNRATADRAMVLARLGRIEEASTLLLSPQDRDGDVDAIRLAILRLAGKPAQADAFLPRVTGDRALALLAVGRSEEALAALNPGGVDAFSVHVWLWNPMVDPIRDDHRFVAFLATLGLTEAHARAQAWRAAHPPEKPDVKI